MEAWHSLSAEAHCLGPGLGDPELFTVLRTLVDRRESSARALMIEAFGWDPEERGL